MQLIKTLTWMILGLSVNALLRKALDPLKEKGPVWHGVTRVAAISATVVAVAPLIMPDSTTMTVFVVALSASPEF
ncbi:hypothetical protein [Largemouth bass virus]|nr:hypothetical protein [Largemouth bass virus]